MSDKLQPVAFVAIWKNKSSEYRATRAEQEETSAQIEFAFTNARERGIRMFGLYGCRWSTGRQYFTFWLCPDFSLLELAMDELDAAGDFKFADSEHMIGVPVGESESLDAGYLTRGGPDEDRPLGILTMIRRTALFRETTGGARKEGEPAVRDALTFALANGARCLGQYDCRWSNKWHYFTFWQFPAIAALEATIDRLERAGAYRFVESRHLLGKLEPHFRFAGHPVIDPSRAEGGY